jgi:putative membrane protein
MRAMSAASSHASIALGSTLILMALVYLRGWFRLRERLPALAQSRRPFAFLGGLFTFWLAVDSPLASLAENLLTVHMVQHLLLSTVAAPLLWLGAPALPLLSGAPRLVADAATRLLDARLVRVSGRTIGQPVLCFIVTMAVLVGWHVPAAFHLAVRSGGWHIVQQASFFVSGLLFWWPVVQPWPSTARWPRWSVPAYLFLATLPCDGLSAFLAFSDRVVYSAYFSAPRLFGISVIQDQEWAGATMWLWTTIAYTIPAAVITTKILSSAGSQAGRRSQRPAYQS